MKNFQNSWGVNNIQNLVTDYNDQANNDFTWISEEDQQVIDVAKSDKSFSFGIPNQIIGDYQNANLFLCLLNPRTRSNTSSITDLKDYINLENKNGGEFFQDNTQAYADHVVNDHENVLVQEFRRLLERNCTPKEIEVVIKQIQSDAKTIFVEKEINTEKVDKNDQEQKYWDDFGQDLVFSNDFNKQLNQELGDLVKGPFNEYLRKEIKNWSEKRNNLFSKTKKNSGYFDFKMVAKFNELLDQKLSAINDMYYFTTYYWPLFVSEKNSKTNQLTYLEDIYRNYHQNEDEFLNKINQYGICNLELLPYRSNEFAGIVYQNGKTLKDIPSVQKIARLVIDRIAEDKDNDNLKFIFRSYSKWREVLVQELANKQGKKISEVVDEFGKDYEKHFYKFPNQSGVISQNNLYKVRIPDDEYAQLKNSIGL